MPRRIRLIGGPVLALVFIGGCGALPSIADVPLLTGVPPGFPPNSAAVGCFTNSAEGPLVADPTYGTAIRHGDLGGATTPVLWRPGFSARRVGFEVEVSDPAGTVVATTGRSYRIAGGYVGGSADTPDIPGGVFWACDFVLEQP